MINKTRGCVTSITTMYLRLQKPRYESAIILTTGFFVKRQVLTLPESVASVVYTDYTTAPFAENSRFTATVAQPSKVTEVLTKQSFSTLRTEASHTYSLVRRDLCQHKLLTSYAKPVPAQIFTD